MMVIMNKARQDRNRPGAAQWSEPEATRQAMLPNFAQTHAAERYRPSEPQYLLEKI
jgi:hypothetical protein